MIGAHFQTFLSRGVLMLRTLRFVVFVGGVALPLAAQAPHATKPTLANADYAKWETLGSGALSPDGKWVAYDFRRGNGSTELHYRAADAMTEQIVRSATTPQFTSNSRWLLFTETPDTAGGGRGGRGGRGSVGGGARNKVGVIDLRTGAQITFDDVSSFILSSDGSHVALRRSPLPGKRGSDVIVRDLDAGAELTFGKVAEIADSQSPLKLGLKGVWKDTRFELTGRAQYRHEFTSGAGSHLLHAQQRYQRQDRNGRQIVRANAAQRPRMTSNRGADGVADISFGHARQIWGKWWTH